MHIFSFYLGFVTNHRIWSQLDLLSNWTTLINVIILQFSFGLCDDYEPLSGRAVLVNDRMSCRLWVFHTAAALVSSIWICLILMYYFAFCLSVSPELINISRNLFQINRIYFNAMESECIYFILFLQYGLTFISSTKETYFYLVHFIFRICKMNNLRARWE